MYKRVLGAGAWTAARRAFSTTAPNQVRATVPRLTVPVSLLATCLRKPA